MSTLHEQKKLSESLLAACKAAGIEKPKYIAQDEDGQVWHYYTNPKMFTTCFSDYGESSSIIDHPPYADDWQDSLLEWVEPEESLSEWKDGLRFTETEKQQIDALADEPLANVLARHPESNKWCITIETERDKDGEPVAYFIRDHKGDIVQMIRPDHIADTSKMIDACDIAYQKMNDEYAGRRTFEMVYRRAWSDALAWWDGNHIADDSKMMVAVNAPASERAEAHARTIGKWKEGA